MSSLSSTQKKLRWICWITVMLAFGVVVMGAYVRLSRAGLGCPDWPFCYGKLMPQESPGHPLEAIRQFEAPKAWKEMIHRYLASTLGFLILMIAIASSKIKKADGRSYLLPWFLVLLVIFQGLLGRWTVTLLLHPLVVMSHLIGGLTTLSLLTWLALSLGTTEAPQKSPFTKLVILGLAILVLQIVLGGWTSANYAALSCPDFPTCQGNLIPPLDVQGAFGVWHDFGRDYDGGVLANAARVTIHFFHRMGALLTGLLLGFIGFKSCQNGSLALSRAGVLVLASLLLQLSLGISNIIFVLPIGIAVAHNAGAALLLVAVINLLHTTCSISDSKTQSSDS